MKHIFHNISLHVYRKLFHTEYDQKAIIIYKDKQESWQTYKRNSAYTGKINLIKKIYPQTILTLYIIQHIRKFGKF